MSYYAPTLRPRQIADLLQYLTGIPFDGQVVRCWRTRYQAQSERWADFEVSRAVVMDLWSWPVGQTRRLPKPALDYMARRKASKV